MSLKKAAITPLDRAGSALIKGGATTFNIGCPRTLHTCASFDRSC